MPQIFEFAAYTLDLTRGCLRAGDRDIELRRKSFEVLTYLVVNAGRLVPKAELLEAIWPDVTVTDESLAKCVSEVRAALGNCDQRLVRTVPRRGYILDTAVSSRNDTLGPPSLALEPAAEPAAIALAGTAKNSQPIYAKLRSGRLIVLFAAAMLIASLAATAAFFPRSRSAGSPPSDRPSIAVLPFLNASGDPAQEYFSDGITEDLIVGFGHFRGLFVIAQNSVFTYKGKHNSPQQVGRELGVRYLLEGSVRRNNDELRVTAELIDTATGGQLWAESYDRQARDIFAVQDEVTQRIVAALIGHIDRSELARISRKPAATLAVYDYYLRGNALIRMRHGESRGEMVARARQLFDGALAADPHYAPALQGLAYTYAAAFLEPMRDGLFRNELRQKAVLDRALTLAQQAVEDDPYLAEAHATLAWILHWQYRRTEAIAEFERAFALNPNLSDGRFAHMLIHDGRAAEAAEFMRRLIRQDPFPPPIYLSYLGNAYYLTGQYEAALNTLRVGAERMPGYLPIPVWLAAAAAQLGRDEEARKAAAAVLRMKPDFTIADWLRHIRFSRQSDTDRLAEGLRKAGFAE